MNSPVFASLTELYLRTGKALPSTTGPWSESEISSMLESIDRDNLEDEYKEIYDYIVSEISHKENVFKFGLKASLEAYIHTDEVNFVGRENWGRDPNSTKPMFTGIMNAWLGDNFYGYTEVNVANAYIMGDEKAKENFGTTKFSTNLIMVPPASMRTLDFEFPHKAYLSAGSKNWNLIWGKLNLGWGNGHTGNFIVGDHLGEHNAIRFSTWIKNFKYSFLLETFPHPMNYYNSNGYNRYSGAQEKLKGLRFFMAHRLEWRTLWDKLSITLTEGLMFMSEDGMVDLAILNPSMFWHNLYTRAHSNSILALEADWTIFKGFNVYGQMVVDEFILPGEPVPGKTETGPAEPSALGFILGANYTMPYKTGIFTFNAEVAYTNPFLYLRDGSTDRNQVKGQYGVNYVVALRRIGQTGGFVDYDEHYLGYRYGGDSIVGNLNAQYKRTGKWGVEANLFFMAHGTFDQWTVWTRINPDNNHPEYPSEEPKTPTTTHVTDNQNDANAKSRDSVEYTLDLTLSGNWNFYKNLTANFGFDWIMVVNGGNLKANGVRNDLQFTLGVTYEL